MFLSDVFFLFALLAVKSIRFFGSIDSETRIASAERIMEGILKRKKREVHRVWHLPRDSHPERMSDYGGNYLLEIDQSRWIACSASGIRS